MRIATQIELTAHARAGCTEPDNPLPRIWITTGDGGSLDVTMPSRDHDAVRFLTALIEAGTQLHGQLHKDLKP